MAATAPLNVRIDEQLKSGLQSISSATERSMAYHTEKALEEYVSREQHQLEMIKEGIACADKGDFVSEEEVDRVFNKYS